jgi:hypothetical protein
MKCSECSAKITPVVVWDVDGTLANYHEHLAWFVALYWNLGEAAYLRGTHWDGLGNFEDVLGITQLQYREAKLAFRQGGQKRTMPIYQDGGIRTVIGMSHGGCDTWYATSRPWARLDAVDPDTRFWLEKHGLPLSGILYDEDDKYGKLISDHLDPARIIGVVEDLPEQYDRGVELGLPMIQVARPHNRGEGVKRPNRVDMRDVAGQLQENLRKWKEHHG